MLSYGQQQWMVNHIATGLHKLGLPVTPETVARELQQLDRLTTAADGNFVPPDPYKAGLDKLRADLPKTPTAPNHRDSSSPPLDSNGIPDPYAAGLEKMRKENR